MADQAVTLRFPATSERVRLARTLAAVLGDEAGFDYEEVEDIRIAVDELVFALLEQSGPSSSLELIAHHEPGLVRIEATVEKAVSSDGSAASKPAELSEISRQILATVIDSYELVLDGDPPRFSFVKQKS